MTFHKSFTGTNGNTQWIVTYKKAHSTRPQAYKHTAPRVCPPQRFFIIYCYISNYYKQNYRANIMQIKSLYARAD